MITDVGYRQCVCVCVCVCVCMYACRGPVITVTVDDHTRVRMRSSVCRRRWNDGRDADVDRTRGTDADGGHRHDEDAGDASTRPGRAGTERRRPAPPASQRAFADLDHPRCCCRRGRRSRLRRHGGIPGDVQVGRPLRRHQGETLLNLHHQHEGLMFAVSHSLILVTVLKLLNCLTIQHVDLIEFICSKCRYIN